METEYKRQLNEEHKLSELFHLISDKSYGRGFRRCLEVMLLESPDHSADADTRITFRHYISEFSPEALEGFDSVDEDDNAYADAQLDAIYKIYETKQA
jgi:ribosome-associated toxin RatA of RatAB toxin-antitoxin module